MNIIKQWKRLSQEDPIARILRRISRDEVAIDNIELDLGLTIFIFPHSCDLEAVDWTLIKTGGAIYWKSDDVAGVMGLPFFPLDLIFPTTGQFQIDSVSMIYHVETNLVAGPKIRLHPRDASGQSDEYSAATTFGTLSPAGATANTQALPPHVVTSIVNQTVDISIPTESLIAVRITEAEQSNDADLRVIGFYLVISRIREGRIGI